MQKDINWKLLNDIWCSESFLTMSVLKNIQTMKFNPQAVLLSKKSLVCALYCFIHHIMPSYFVAYFNSQILVIAFLSSKFNFYLRQSLFIGLIIIFKTSNSDYTITIHSTVSNLKQFIYYPTILWYQILILSILNHATGAEHVKQPYIITSTAPSSNPTASIAAGRPQPQPRLSHLKYDRGSGPKLNGSCKKRLALKSW